MMFQKATKEQAKLRMAIIAPSGAGKTFSALRVANGLAEKENGRIAFIDTEFKTASKYADRFDFDKVDYTNETPIGDFTRAIQEAGSAGYKVIIIDSMSHAWESMLDAIEVVAKARYNGNTFAAWKDKAGGKLQTEFTNAILKSPAHIICCFRQATDWVMETNERGKTVPKRVGTRVKQKEGIEHEFDMLLEGNLEHYFTVTKDRTGKYQDAIFDKPGEQLGYELYDWLKEGVPPVPSVEENVPHTQQATVPPKENSVPPIKKDVPKAEKDNAKYVKTITDLQKQFKDLGKELSFLDVMRSCGLTASHEAYKEVYDREKQLEIYNMATKYLEKERGEIIDSIKKLLANPMSEDPYNKLNPDGKKLETLDNTTLLKILVALK